MATFDQVLPTILRVVAPSSLEPLLEKLARLDFAGSRTAPEEDNPTLRALKTLLKSTLEPAVFASTELESICQRIRELAGESGDEDEDGPAGEPAP